MKDVLILAQFRLLDEDKITIKNGVLPRELGLLAKRLLEKESTIFTVQPWPKVIFIWDLTKNEILLRKLKKEEDLIDYLKDF